MIPAERRCEAIYQVNEELHACRRHKGHLGRHRARYVIYERTHMERPLWASDVTLRWSTWRSIRGS